MLNAVQLFFSPFATWQKIAIAKKGVAFTALLYLAPLLLLVCASECYALVVLSEKDSLFSHMKLPLDRAIRVEVCQWIAGMILVFIAAKMIRWIGESFNFYPPFERCFTLAAYGLGPFFMAHFLNCIPGMNPWITAAIGIFGCIYVLYQGTGVVLEPEQTKGFGLYIMIAILFSMLSAMMHILWMMAIQGKIPV